MAKTSLDEKWRYCARCDYRHAASNLRFEPKTGREYCTAQVHCDDEPNRDDMRRQYYQKGRIFDQ